VVAGEDDPITPVEEQQAIVNAMRPGLARLVSFPRCGHGVLRDDAEGLLAAVAAFIAE
jgi:pimeloyl-ACP methyl ester carboxylesterase